MKRVYSVAEYTDHLFDTTLSDRGVLLPPKLLDKLRSRNAPKFPERNQNTDTYLVGYFYPNDPMIAFADLYAQCIKDVRFKHQEAEIEIILGHKDNCLPLPPQLQQHLGITKQVLIYETPLYFEVWDKNAYLQWMYNHRDMNIKDVAQLIFGSSQPKPLSTAERMLHQKANLQD